MDGARARATTHVSGEARVLGSTHQQRDSGSLVIVTRCSALLGCHTPRTRPATHRRSLLLCLDCTPAALPCRMHALLRPTAARRPPTAQPLPRRWQRLRLHPRPCAVTLRWMQWYVCEGLHTFVRPPRMLYTHFCSSRLRREGGCAARMIVHASHVFQVLVCAWIALMLLRVCV